MAKKSCPSISWGVRVLLAAAGTFLSALANAAIIHVGFDPAFGAPFSDLSYQGSADLTMPSTCPGSGVGILSIIAGACAGTTLDNTTVELYLTGTPTTNETVIDGSSLSHPPVNDIVVSPASAVIGLDTDWFDVGTAGAIGTFPGGHIYLQFVSNTDTQDVTTAPTVFIALGDCTISDNGTTLSGDGCNKSVAPPAGVTFTPTVTFPAPEPGSLYLVMLALGALPLCRWRRGRMF